MGCSSIFFFNDTATAEIYTLSLHDALPIWYISFLVLFSPLRWPAIWRALPAHVSTWCLKDKVLSHQDRKSTRLNSSHANISYAVFCLKKKTISSRPQLTSLTSRQ